LHTGAHEGSTLFIFVGLNDLNVQSLQGYSTCGVENQDGHYSGNFWWADCQHVAQLEPMRSRFDPWGVEYFVLKVRR
jgi:hypothetical protein